MSKISLCIIVGNVEEYIERCLKSFAPIADEICMVRAIGNQKPDGTIEVAEPIIRRASISFNWSEYKNSGLVHPKDGPSETWPHIDNFAAARQQSFDMATGDYVFWADTDDILKEGADIVRQCAARNGYPVFMFPYEIFGRGVDFTRERMILRGAGKWKFPVHECFKFHNENVQGIQDDRVIVQHLPHTSKTGSNERNLRIMESIPEEEMTPGLRYHLHGELLGTPGRQADAIEAAKKALADKELGKPERYEIFLNLGRMAKQPHEARAFFHQAYMTDPCRREALGLLTCNALDYQRYPESLAFARQMLATNKPATESWNDRKAAYEWLGIEIYTQALRMNGERVEAERCRKALLASAGSPIISLIHATRGRPRQASIARKMWLDLAERPEAIEHIFVIDQDDEASAPLRRMHSMIVPAGGGCVNAWNSGALVCTGDVLIQMSDDWMPPPRWDTLILQKFGYSGAPNGGNVEGSTPSPVPLSLPRVLAVSDGHRKDDLLCMAIITQAYFVQDYFMFHPLFTGVYSDNWFTKEAYRRGQVLNARDLVFTHNHPAFDKSVAIDETYALQNDRKSYKKGKKIYDRLCESQAMLDTHEPPTSCRGVVDWSTVPGWFNYWQLYRKIAEALEDGDYVAEIGVWLGRSIIFLAQECKRLGKDVKIIGVDTFRGESNQTEHEATVKLAGGSLYKSYQANIERCGVADIIETFIGDSVEQSVEVLDGQLKFCFIDAAHDYDSVRRDITAWLPKVKPGGILAGHDADWPEVQKAVKEAFPDALINGSVWIHVVAHQRCSHGAQPPCPTGAPAEQAGYKPQSYRWNEKLHGQVDAYNYSP